MNPSQWSAAGFRVRFTDDINIASYAVISNFGENDVIAFLPGAEGLLAISSQGSNVTLTVNRNGIVSNIVLKGVVSAGSIIYDVASFNALPIGDIRFDGPEAVSGNSLDSLGGTLSNPAIFDAGTAAHVLTDDARQASNVRIMRFGADDVLRLQNTTAALVAVSSRGADVTFVINNGGAVSSVTLVGVMPPGALVHDITSFNALGVGKVQVQ